MPSRYPAWSLPTYIMSVSFYNDAITETSLRWKIRMFLIHIICNDFVDFHYINGVNLVRIDCKCVITYIYHVFLLLGAWCIRSTRGSRGCECSVTCTPLSVVRVTVVDVALRKRRNHSS